MASVLRVPRLCTHRPRSGSPLSFPQSFIAYPHPSYSSTWNRQVRKPERQVKEEAKQRARKAEKAEKAENTLRKKRKARMAFIQHDLRDAVHFSLVDAMRYDPLEFLLQSKSIFFAISLLIILRRCSEFRTEPRLAQLYPGLRGWPTAYFGQIRTRHPPSQSEDRPCHPKPPAIAASSQHSFTDCCNMPHPLIHGGSCSFGRSNNRG